MKSATELKKGDILYVIYDPRNEPTVVVCEITKVIYRKLSRDVIVGFNLIIGRVYGNDSWLLNSETDLNKIEEHWGALFTINENEFLKYIEEHFNE